MPQLADTRTNMFPIIQNFTDWRGNFFSPAGKRYIVTRISLLKYLETMKN